MKLIEIIKSSFTSLRMNGRRTFLTMFGIIIGIAAVITILSLGNGFRQKTLDELVKDDQGRQSQSFYFNVTSLEEEDYQKLNPFNDQIVTELEELPGVDEIKLDSEESDPQVYASFKQGRKDKVDIVYGYEEETDLPLLAGRNLMKADNQAKRHYLIIDEHLAANYFEDFQAAINQSVDLDEQPYTIVGIFQSQMSEEDLANQDSFGFGTSSNPQAYIPQASYKRDHPQESKNFGITAYFEEGANIKSVSKAIADYLKDHGPDKDNGEYGYYDTSEMMAEIGKQLDMVTLFISAVASISLFIAGIGVMNMMYISVSERTREIGIRRSIGATQTSIQTQFLLEGIAITTFGGLLGYLLGLGLAALVGNFLPFKAVYDLKSALISVAIAVLIGLVFSYFPARQAARKNVVEILR